MTRRKNKRFEAVEEFLSTKRLGTKNAYHSHLTNYFKIINKNPNEYITKDIRRLNRDKELNVKDAIEKDLKSYSQKIKNEPPKTQHVKLMAVKKF